MVFLQKKHRKIGVSAEPWLLMEMTTPRIHEQPLLSVEPVVIPTVPPNWLSVAFFPSSVFISCLRDRFSHHCCKKTLPPGQRTCNRQIRWRCAHKKEFCGCTPTWRCPAPVSFRQPFCCAEEDRFCPCHHIHVQRLKRRQVRLEFSLRFPNVDHFCVHSPPLAPSIVTCFFISPLSGRDPGR